MSRWSQGDLQPLMKVYGVDDKEIGHVAETYEDSFLVKKGVFFSKDRYIPYSAIKAINGERVDLTMSSDEVEQKEWEKRPDYEDHAGDPVQLFYDRGHGVHDPADEENPDQS